MAICKASPFLKPSDIPGTENPVNNSVRLLPVIDMARLYSDRNAISRDPIQAGISNLF